MWTGGGPAPQEYLTYVLWRHLYNCTPLELEEIVARFGVRRVLLDLEMSNLEAENRRLKLEQKYGR